MFMRTPYGVHIGPWSDAKCLFAMEISHNSILTVHLFGNLVSRSANGMPLENGESCKFEQGNPHLSGSETSITDIHMHARVKSAN